MNQQSNQSSGIVKIDGNEYRTVALRVFYFRKDNPDYSIVTDILKINASVVLMKASILKGSTVIATGHAEEYRNASEINSHSAVECAETSAVGRALAYLGYLGETIYSQEELEAKRNSHKVKEKSGYEDQGYENSDPERPFEKPLPVIEIEPVSASNPFDECVLQLKKNNFMEITANTERQDIADQAFAVQGTEDGLCILAKTRRTTLFLESLGFVRDPEQPKRFKRNFSSDELI
jgi:hypothetical protein